MRDLLLLVLLTSFGAACGANDPCASAASHLESCIGRAPATASCNAEEAAWVMAQDCGTLQEGDAKSDGDTGLWAWIQEQLSGVSASWGCARNVCSCPNTSTTPTKRQVVTTTLQSSTGSDSWKSYEGIYREEYSYSYVNAEHGQSVSWSPTIETPGSYRVSAWLPQHWPVTFLFTSLALGYHFSVCQAGSERDQPMRLAVPEQRGRFVEIGVFALHPGSTLTLEGQDSTGLLIAGPVLFERM